LFDHSHSHMDEKEPRFSRSNLGFVRHDYMAIISCAPCLYTPFQLNQIRSLEPFLLTDYRKGWLTRESSGCGRLQINNIRSCPLAVYRFQTSRSLVSFFFFFQSLFCFNHAKASPLFPEHLLSLARR